MRTSIDTRFWSKVDKSGPNACWWWLGAIDGTGYGSFFVDGRRVGAHRFSYELAFGPIGEGLVLDHLCRNRPCVNPGHLEPVSHRINILRGAAPSADNAIKTRCYRGHVFTPENTLLRQPRRLHTGSAPSRVCRECDRIKRRAYRAKRRAA